MNSYSRHDYNPLGDGISRLQVVDILGSDLSVVNGARVSFGRTKEEFTDKDTKLINYLLKHNHVSPFYHPQLTFKVKCPIFIAREWFRHTVGCSYNEISMRYIDQTKSGYEPQYYVPKEWRSQNKDNKQASGEALTEEHSKCLHVRLKHHSLNSTDAYTYAISLGASREMARMFLPVNIYTEFIWTASLYAVLHFIKLRSSSDAQLEIQVYSNAIESVLEAEFPATHQAFKENKYVS